MDDKNIPTTPQVVEVPVKAPPVDKAVIIRSIGLLIICVNAIIAVFKSGFEIKVDPETIYEAVSGLAVLAGIVIAWFKSHPITKKARIKEEAAKQVEIPQKSE